MTKRKTDATMLSISKDDFLNRIAWLRWKGCHQEAVALCDLAAWFQPPLRIDDADIDRRVRELSAPYPNLDDPTRWS